MCSYGWTIDYINESVTIPQILLLMDEIKNNPPTAIMTFGFTDKNLKNTMQGNISDFGDKVIKTKFFDDSIKSVIRLKDGVKLK